MASESQTTSSQRLYPGLARVRLSFPFVISGEGPASLKPRAGQGSSLSGGSEQKLNVAEWPLPVTRRGLGFGSPQFAPEVHLEKLTCKEHEKNCVPPTPVRAGLALRPPCTLYPPGHRSSTPTPRPQGTLVLGLSYENHGSNREKQSHGEVRRQMKTEQLGGTPSPSS